MAHCCTAEALAYENTLLRHPDAHFDQNHALTEAEVVHTGGRYMHALSAPVCTPGFDLAPLVSDQEALQHFVGAKPDHQELETLKGAEQHSMLSKPAKQGGRSASEDVLADAAKTQKLREPVVCMAA